MGCLRQMLGAETGATIVAGEYLPMPPWMLEDCPQRHTKEIGYDDFAIVGV